MNKARWPRSATAAKTTYADLDRKMEAFSAAEFYADGQVVKKL